MMRARIIGSANGKGQLSGTHFAVVGPSGICHLPLIEYQGCRIVTSTNSFTPVEAARCQVQRHGLRRCRNSGSEIDEFVSAILARKLKRFPGERPAQQSFASPSNSVCLTYLVGPERCIQRSIVGLLIIAIEAGRWN